MVEHPYGWLSLAPPLVAVALALITHRVLTSLFAGLAIGALILSHGDPVTAIASLLETQLWNTLVQPDKLRVFAFTLLMGATIGVINISGGMLGLIELIAPLAHSRRSGQLATWLLGLVIFFDDYANCLLIGSSMQPTCDRLKISREKLAYLVDSTAAPVAGVALVSTWIAVELDYVREGLSNLDANVGGTLNPFELFVACIPYRFYVIQALLFMPMIAILGRDFGPMLSAERRAIQRQNQGNASSAAGGNPYDDGTIVHAAHWSNALIPLGLILAVVLWLIYATGAAKVAQSAPELAGFERLREVFGSADSSLALYYGGLAGLVSATLLASWRVGVAKSRIVDAAWRGARVVMPAIAILLLATTMSRMTSNKSVDNAPSVTPFEFEATRLYTGDFLKDQLLHWSGGNTATFAIWLPTIVFLLSSFVSFCTGTSYGTMGILIPMVIPLAAAALAASSPTDLSESAIFLCTLGSVLSGAIFGDHCSPISDTTILSSQASACDHMAHVNTQLPYAMVVGAVASVFGTVLVGYGVSVWILLPLQTAVLFGILMLVGRRIQAHGIEALTEEAGSPGS